MPGRRYSDFRGGDLAEDLGIFLLKLVCAVAPVPRQEDFGVDAVATLLRKDGKFLVAEESFYVQIKCTKRPIVFSVSEVEWLRGLRLPFYIAYVDRTKTSITLYAAFDPLWTTLDSTAANEICLCFGKTTKRAGRPQLLLRDHEVLSWSSTELSREEVAEEVYSALKRDLVRQNENLRMRKYGVQRMMIRSGKDAKAVARYSNREKIKVILDDAKEAILALGVNCALFDPSGVEVVMALCDYAKTHGVSIDSDDTIRWMENIINYPNFSGPLSKST